MNDLGWHLGMTRNVHYAFLTFQCGFCGIPPALVQRYSAELPVSISEVASIMDEYRIKCLQQQGRIAVSYSAPLFFVAYTFTMIVVASFWGYLVDGLFVSSLF